MTHRDNGQTPSDLVQTTDLLRRERPEAGAVRLDEIKRDVLTKSTRSRQPRLVASMRRKLMAVTLFVLLFGLSTSSAAASLLSWVSGGSFGSNTLGYGDSSGGTKFFFGSFGFGGDSSDDAGEETYCPDDKGSDDGDGSSSDDSDGDGDERYSAASGQSGGGDDGSDDGDKSSGDHSDDGGGECESDDGSEKSDDNDKSSDDKSDEKSDDGDGSSDDKSDEKSDDGDGSSGDNSDGDSKSDDGDGSSDDKSDEKSDDGDGSSADNSDEKSDDGDGSSDDQSD